MASDETPAAAPPVPPAATTDAPAAVPSDAPADAPTQTESPTPPDQAASALDGQRQDEPGDDDERTTRTTPRYTNPYAPPSDDQK